jgi:hypothetical protein
MSDLDLDALEATASAPNMDRDSSYVTSATDTLALIARIREAEREMHARELHHFEAEKLLAEAEATIDAALAEWDKRTGWMEFGTAVHRILTRHQDKREGGADDDARGRRGRLHDVRLRIADGRLPGDQQRRHQP